jgi:hypothetical protein
MSGYVGLAAYSFNVKAENEGLAGLPMSSVRPNELWMDELVREPKRPYGPTAQGERGASSTPGRGTVTRGPNPGRRGRA